MRKIRLRNCAKLHRERAKFMNKLDNSRINRTILERFAAIVIQKVYRGHCVRFSELNYEGRGPFLSAKLRSLLERGKALHFTGRELVKGADESMILSGMDFRGRYSAERRKKAVTIQCAYRLFIARRCLRRKMYEAIAMQKISAATRIQCLARYLSCSARVKMNKERKQKAMTRKMATLIQTHVRALYARRRVRKRRFMMRWVSASMIQGWYRYKKAKIQSLRIKEIVLQQRYFLGAQGMQCLVRRKISRARVNRIRLRRLYLVLYQSATRIGTLMRQYLAKRRVYLIRLERGLSKMGKDNEKADSMAVRESMQNILENDAFAVAKAGDVERLEDLYTANGTMISKMDTEGNSILLVAALHGQLEVVKKCFEWDFDLNQRNTAGFTPLMVAVQEGHADIASSILQPPMKFKLDRFAPDDSAFLWFYAMNNMNPLLSKLRGKNESSDAVLKLLQEASLPVTGKHSVFANGSPILAACHLGNVALFRYMLKAKSDLGAIDDNKNTALHFAVKSSLDIVKLVLGLDSSAGILVPDSKRAPMLLAKNSSGHDCRLLAAMAGQEKILKFCESICSANREAMLHAKKTDDLTLSWSLEDLHAVLLLIETGNEACLKYVLDAGFDTSLRVEDKDNSNIMMWACLYGHLPIIDMLMAMKLNFQDHDAKGKTALHYAARCTTEAVVAHLLSHENAADCGLSQDSVTVVDISGATPMHVAATNNVQVKIDLIASHGLEQALNTADSQGMTPMLLACKHHHAQIVLDYLALNVVDISAVDNDGHNALYHLSHSVENRPLASELRAELGLQGKQSRAERSENLARLYADVELVLALVEAGCQLFASRIVTAEELIAVPIAGVRDPTKLLGVDGEDRSRFDPGDLIVQDMALTLLKRLPENLSDADCWRLLLSSIRYDEGTNKSLAAVLEGGIADKLLGIKPVRKQPISNNPKNAEINPSIAQLADGVTFGGLTVAGWCIKLGNHQALNLLRKNKYNMCLPADISGNCALHLVARFGTAPMVDIIIESESVQIEGLNQRGRTPLMEAAMSDNFRVAKRLVGCHASARRGLAGKYCAWLLVMARRQEENVKSLQTGRIGEDDEMYFPSPEPTWYEDAMAMTMV